MAVINELRGRILQCFCFPWPCHGDILAELANGSETTKKATSPRIEKISIHDLTLNDRCQSRGALNQDTVKDYARLYEEAPDVLPPIEVFLHGDASYVVDGFHRVEAAKEAGLEELNACLHGPTESFDDLLLFAASVNAKHGLHRSSADKRRQVRMVLSARPRWSDRSIAKHCGVHHQLVASVRKDSLDESASDTQGIRRTYRSKHGTVATMNVDHIGRSRVGDNASVTIDNSDASVASLPDEPQEDLVAEALAATVPQPGNTDQTRTSQDIDASRLAYVVLPDDLDKAAAILQQRYSDDELFQLAAILQHLSAKQNQSM